MHRPPTTFEVDGAAIRELRMSRGEDIAALAARAGISRSYLSLLETGRRRHMRPPKYTALRTAMGIEPDDEQLLAPTEDSDPEEVT
jgi:transcriptional regulator with XRE-family HTH domain